MWLVLKDQGMSGGERAVKGNERGDQHEIDLCRDYGQDFIGAEFDEEFWLRVMNLKYKLCKITSFVILFFSFFVKAFFPIMNLL